MKDNELKRISRKELLELLIEQGQENEEMKASIEELRAKLADRELRLSQVGTLAEASLSLNGVLEAADRAAAQYLENARRTADELAADAEECKLQTRAECDRMRLGCEQECDRLLFAAQEEANRLLSDAEARRTVALRRLRDFCASHPELDSAALMNELKKG